MPPKPLHEGESELAGIIRTTAEQVHNEVPKEYTQLYHACGIKDGYCQLSQSLEALFAGFLAQRLSNRVLQIQNDWTESEILYAPHTTSEANVGFDYSLGYFSGPRRVRWMHKHASNWCDDKFTWTAKGAEKSRCGRHAKLLLKQFNSNRDHIRPFLIMSVCYCLHEYRRMGRNGVPQLDDPRRWIIADLRSLADWDPEHILAAEFEYTRTTEDSSFIVRCGENEVNLQLLNFQEFLDLAGFLCDTPL